MSQDAIVTAFTTIATTNAADLSESVMEFYIALGKNLLDCLTLDSDHKTSIAAVDKTALISLFALVNRLQTTLQTAINAPSVA